MKNFFATALTVMVCCSVTKAQNTDGVSISMGNTPPHPNAMLDVAAGTGNNKGMLVPRVTRAQMDALLINTAASGTTTAKPDGLMVYVNSSSNNDDIGFWYWKDAVGTAAAGWQKLGNGNGGEIEALFNPSTHTGPLNQFFYSGRTYPQLTLTSTNGYHDPNAVPNAPSPEWSGTITYYPKFCDQSFAPHCSSNRFVFNASVQATGIFMNSDENLKDNFSPLFGTDALNILNSMNLHKYQWNDEADYDDFLHFGVKAQEVEQISELSQLVSTGVDGTKAMNYMELVPILVSAVKRLEARVASLEEHLVNTVGYEVPNEEGYTPPEGGGDENPDE